MDKWRGVMIVGVGEARIGDAVGTHDKEKFFKEVVSGDQGVGEGWME